MLTTINHYALNLCKWLCLVKARYIVPIRMITMCLVSRQRQVDYSVTNVFRREVRRESQLASDVLETSLGN